VLDNDMMIFVSKKTIAKKQQRNSIAVMKVLLSESSDVRVAKVDVLARYQASHESTQNDLYIISQKTT